MNILFVCTGNTCRSPLAEALLKARHIQDLEVRSAGLYAMDGGDMSMNGQIVLESNSIPFDHASSSLTNELVDWADLILTMTGSHKQATILSFPHAISKIYMYTEYATPEDIHDVTDPYGGDLRTYEHTFQELQALTEELVKKLQGD